MILILAALSLFPTTQTEDWYSLLQSRYQLGCSADFLISSGIETGVLAGDLPVVAIGSTPVLPWPDAHTADPLNSGIWGGGRWNTRVVERAFQDSSSISKIGLIQNTLDHSRYIFQLDRPLPWRMSGNFQILREDSVQLTEAVLERGPFNMRTMSWEGMGYGWGSWTGWKSPQLYARAGYSRLTPGDRRPELLAGFMADLASFSFEIGAAGSYVDSTLQGRGVAGISTYLGNAHASGYFEYNDDGESLWGGIKLPAGSFEFSAALSSPAGDELFHTLAVRHPDFNIVARFFNETAVAADAQVAKGFFRGKGAACWNFQDDILSTTSWMLLGVNWYRARIETGPRFTAVMDSTGTWVETIDLLLGFTLASFSLESAVEDITQDADRSWSFGITWAFTDEPPVTPVEETEGERGE